MNRAHHPIWSVLPAVLCLLVAVLGVVSLSPIPPLARADSGIPAPEHLDCTVRSAVVGDETRAKLPRSSTLPASRLDQTVDIAPLAANSITATNATRIPIPDNDGWVGSRIDVTEAPANAIVVAIDVHIVIRHPFIGDLVIDLANAPETQSVRLWDRQGGGAQDIDRSWYKLTTFSGLPVNGGWQLWVKDEAPGDSGFIESWTMTLHYSIPTATPTPTCAISVPSPYIVRVNAGGGDYTDVQGQQWLADRQFGYCTPPFWGASGGLVYANSQPIEGTADATLYQSHRYFPTTGGYAFHAPNGAYDIQLRFAEIYPWAWSDKRVFDIAIQGQKVVSDLNVFGQAGGLYRPLDLTFSTVVTDGFLRITFIRNPNSDAPFISAIAITETAPLPTATPTSTATPTPTVPPGRYVTDVPASSDSMTSRCCPNANYSAAWELSAGSLQSMRSWFKFNLADYIPANAEVSHADLFVWRLADGDITTNVYAPVAAWSDTTLTWNTQPAFDPMPFASQFVPAGTPAYVSWDITELVLQWMSGQANNGIMITDDNQTGTVTFASRENAFYSRPAFLRVYYVVGPITEPPTPTPTINPIILPTSTPTATPSPTLTPTPTVSGVVQTPSPTATGTVVLPVVRFNFPIVMVDW